MASPYLYQCTTLQPVLNLLSVIIVAVLIIIPISPGVF
jgi:hypothetical protein